MSTYKLVINYGVIKAFLRPYHNVSFSKDEKLEHYDVYVPTNKLL